MLGSYELFLSWDVALYKIPPGEPSVSLWNLDRKNVIWRGRLVLLEEYHDSSDDEEPSQAELAQGGSQRLLCKLELYNVVSNQDTENGDRLWNTQAATQSDDSSDTDHQRSQLWAEVWFVPQDEIYGDTIHMCVESPQYYRVIAQLPGSGCTGGGDKVALGLKFRDRAEGMIFGESVNIFQRRYRDWKGDHEMDDLLRKLALLTLQDKEASFLSRDQFGPPDKDESDSDDDDDEFGDYIGIDA